ncbi:MAG: FxsA family protein [Thiomargarita sp.]|nr:FxsA family protein [Thiomargarita sp.]
MNLFHILLILFIIVPIFEIYLLMTVGSAIGVLPTVALVIFTAVLGTYLLRSQGLATLKKLQNTFHQTQMPAIALLEGVLILLGGALLLTPGFFTDAIGFACLIPIIRRNIVKWVINRFLLQSYAANSYTHTKNHNKKPHSNITIEGEYKHDD